jgi:hypothetical protein
MILLVNVAYANGERYFIKLGSFKNLQGLERSIEHMPNSLRSHVVIVHSNSWYIPFAYYVKTKHILYPHVKKFKRYFPDAHINHSAYMLHHPVVRNYATKNKPQTRTYTQPIQRVNHQPVRQSFIQHPISSSYQNVAISSDDNTLNVPLQTYSTPIKTLPVTSKSEVIEENGKDYKYFTKKMLSGKHYYLAYKSTQNSPDLLIKVSFENHKVVYHPIIGNMKMTDANYLIENQRLYMFATTFTKDGAYSTLDEHKDNHFLVSSWVNGKKMNTLRYYYMLNDAKEYLGLETSNGLANVLESGSYDEYFLDEEN